MKITDTLKGRLDSLPSLLALLELRSVTLAAEKMRVTQPAMSRTLEQLRGHFGDPLLVRVGAEMHLTPKAETLLEPLRRVLSAAGELYSTTTFDPAQASREFNVVIPDVLAVHILPRLLDKFLAAAPSCRLQLLPWINAESRTEPLDLIISSEVDGFPHFRQQPLFRDHDVLVLPPGIKKPRNPFKLDYVAVVPAGLREDPVDRWLKSEGHTRQIKTTVPHYLLAIQLVASTGLAAILPSKMVKVLGESLPVKTRELPVAQSPDQIWLLYPPRLRNDSASQWLRGLIKNVCGE